MRGFVWVPLRLRSNWPHPDASVENSVLEPNVWAFRSLTPPCQGNGLL